MPHLSSVPFFLDFAVCIPRHLSDDWKHCRHGKLFVINGSVTVGNLQAFIRYIWQINDPLSQVSQLSSQVQSAYAAMNRIFTLLNETEEVQKGSVKIDVSQIQGNVTFDHVQFGYTDELLMKDVSFWVQSGQMVAIVGPTGAGKTTLMNLLLRFYDVNGGSIKIDGIDIRDMDRSDLRSLFSLVLQDTWLFPAVFLKTSVTDL